MSNLSFIPWLATDSSNLPDTKLEDLPIVRLNGLTIADHIAKMPLSSELDVDECGDVSWDVVAPGNPNVWTGTEYVGDWELASSPDSCESWTSLDPQANGFIGQIDPFSSGNWAAHGAAQCGVAAHLYCFEIE